VGAPRPGKKKKNLLPAFWEVEGRTQTVSSEGKTGCHQWLRRQRSARKKKSAEIGWGGFRRKKLTGGKKKKRPQEEKKKRGGGGKDAGWLLTPSTRKIFDKKDRETTTNWAADADEGGKELLLNGKVKEGKGGGNQGGKKKPWRKKDKRSGDWPRGLGSNILCVPFTIYRGGF